jgi:hypothetical protein
LKFWFIILLVLFGSCRSTKSISEPAINSGKLGIDFNSSDGDYNLRGIGYFSPDSNYVNIFGPLGINLIKLKTEGDSIKIVDIQNKKVYYSVYRNVSAMLNNIFNGRFSDDEELLICAMYLLIKNEVLCTELFVRNNKIKYSFRIGLKKYDIFLNIRSELVHYTINVNFYRNLKISLASDDFMKYSNFESIFVKLQ